MNGTLNETDVFLAAIEIDDPKSRDAYLDAACAGDDKFRQRVEALVRQHLQSEGVLDAPPPGLVATIELPTIDEMAGMIIGPYRLLQQIGEGGMGVVFMAEQSEPLQRTVALKIIKPGMDTRQVIARFEAERQAVAMMDHPNIAKVLDAGTTDSGRPYFVMELVKGIAITKYCDDKHLPLRARLEMFLHVCQAVQHAHQKGIIHRDIKPNNVLVAEYDHQPVPKVIDFGVAKATAHRLTERTMFTEFGQVLGTMEYMSPEQSKLNQLDVDTRSDVYSLGVLLYELLAGSTPFEGTRLKEAAFDEMLRIIREEEPPKPSTRLSSLSLGERAGVRVPSSLASIAANRQTEPARLSKDVRGELDWIVMKALEKDRNRRYETASGFAADVERHLQDQAVEAGPPSAAYRFRKFARRNRAALVTSALALVAVLLIAATAGWAVRDRAGRRATVAARAEQVLVESETLYHQRKLPEAVQVARSALALVDGGAGGPAAERRALEWLKDLDMVARLEEINPRNDVHPVRKLGEYPQAFREYGIDIEALSPEDAAARIRASSISLDLVVALDRWVYYAFTYGFHLGPDDEKQVAQQAVRLRQIARLADPDPMRNQLRADGKVDAAEMRRIAASVDVATTPMATLMLIGHAQPEWSEMGAFFTRVQRQRPSDFGVTFYLGRLLLISGDTDNAIRYLTAALSIRPQSGHTRLELGRALIRKGLVDEGIAQLEEASRLAPNTTAKSRYQLEIGYILLGKHGSEEAAAAAFLEAIRLAPDPEHPVDQAGKMRALDGVVAAYLNAARLRPDDFALQNRLASFYAHRGQWDEAVAAFARAAALNPGDFWATYRWATLCFHTGDREQHRRACRMMIQRFGETEIVGEAGGIATVCSLGVEFAAGRARVSKLADRNLTGTESAIERQTFHVAKSLVAYRAGRFDAAVAALIHASPTMDGTPRDALAFSILAMAQHRLGNSEESRAALSNAQRILSKMPDLSKGQTFGEDWHDWLHAQALCREAVQELKDAAIQEP